MKSDDQFAMQLFYLEFCVTIVAAAIKWCNTISNADEISCYLFKWNERARLTVDRTNWNVVQIVYLRIFWVHDVQVSKRYALCEFYQPGSLTKVTLSE